jgi:hypothetical protein
MACLLERKSIFFRRQRVQSNEKGDKEISQFFSFLEKKHAWENLVTGLILCKTNL